LVPVGVVAFFSFYLVPSAFATASLLVFRTPMADTPTFRRCYFSDEDGEGNSDLMPSASGALELNMISGDGDDVSPLLQPMRRTFSLPDDDAQQQCAISSNEKTESLRLFTSFDIYDSAGSLPGYADENVEDQIEVITLGNSPYRPCSRVDSPEILVTRHPSIVPRTSFSITTVFRSYYAATLII